MKKDNFYFLYSLGALLFTALLLTVSCKKENSISDRILLESYINMTGHDMEITRYLNNLPPKTFSIASKDTFIIEYPDNITADTTLTIRHADSAKVVFADAKSYTMYDTIDSPRNFLNTKNFISTISPSGKTHYLRFTFTTADYGEEE